MHWHKYGVNGKLFLAREAFLRLSVVELQANHRGPIQIEVGHGKKAIVIFVPVPLLQNFHKIQQRYEIADPCRFTYFYPGTPD